MKMQEEFINIASHELRTPTQAVLAYAELLQHHPEKRDEMINAIKRNATRLQKLTEDFLDVTKIEDKTLKLHKDKVNLNELLSTVVNDHKNNIEKNKSSNVRIFYNNLYNDIYSVEADSQRIIQALSNLLDNAIKFTTEKYSDGDIYVTIGESKEGEDGRKGVVVKIKDIGIGI